MCEPPSNIARIAALSAGGRPNRDYPMSTHDPIEALGILSGLGVTSSAKVTDIGRLCEGLRSVPRPGMRQAALRSWPISSAPLPKKNLSIAALLAWNGHAKWRLLFRMRPISGNSCYDFLNLICVNRGHP